jgi:hypothetical protein
MKCNGASKCVNNVCDRPATTTPAAANDVGPFPDFLGVRWFYWLVIFIASFCILVALVLLVVLRVRKSRENDRLVRQVNDARARPGTLSLIFAAEDPGPLPTIHIPRGPYDDGPIGPLANAAIPAPLHRPSYAQADAPMYYESATASPPPPPPMNTPLPPAPAPYAPPLTMPPPPPPLI